MNCNLLCDRNNQLNEAVEKTTSFAPGLAEDTLSFELFASIYARAHIFISPIIFR